MRKGKLAALFGLVMCTGLLIGCKLTADKVVLERQDETVISFSWWGNDERHQYTLEGIRIFEEKNPNIRVTKSYGVWDGYERRNRIAMKSHTEADVMLVNYSWLYEYSQDGEGYYDLNDLSDVIDLSQFSREDLMTGTVNGHLNALPTANNMSLMYFNQDLFEKYGLKIPKTWDDLFQAAKVMKKDGIYPLGTVRKHLFLLLQAHYEQTTGKTLFNKAGKFTGSLRDVEELLIFYKKLVDEKVLMPIDEYDVHALANEEVAGIECWISDAGRYCRTIQDKGRCVVQAELLGMEDSDTMGWYMKPATMYAMSADVQNPKQAGKLMNFLLSDPEMALLTGTEKGVPVSNTALKSLEEHNMLDSLEYTSTQYLNAQKSRMNIIIPTMEDNDIIYGFKSIADDYLYGQHGLHNCANDILSLMRDRASE